MAGDVDPRLLYAQITGVPPDLGRSIPWSTNTLMAERDAYRAAVSAGSVPEGVMATCENVPEDREPLHLRDENCVGHDRSMRLCLMLVAGRRVIAWAQSQGLSDDALSELEDTVARCDEAEDVMIRLLELGP